MPTLKRGDFVQLNSRPRYANGKPRVGQVWFKNKREAIVVWPGGPILVHPINHLHNYR